MSKSVRKSANIRLPPSVASIKETIGGQSGDRGALEFAQSKLNAPPGDRDKELDKIFKKAPGQITKIDDEKPPSEYAKMNLAVSQKDLDDMGILLGKLPKKVGRATLRFTKKDYIRFSIAEQLKRDLKRDPEKVFKQLYNS